MRGNILSINNSCTTVIDKLSKEEFNILDENFDNYLDKYIDKWHDNLKINRILNKFYSKR